MKQKLSLTQLSKAQMEHVVAGVSTSEAAMCSDCYEVVTLVAQDIGQNCNCSSIFNAIGLNI